jgi:trehalose/maltose transport system substrate-binding protein
MAENPNIRVGVRPVPRSNNERLELYQELLNQESDEIDVLQIDVVWVGVLAKHALDLSGFIPEAEISEHFPSIIENNTVDGQLACMPLYADAPNLFYRRDLLTKYGFDSPPETWEELRQMSEVIASGERKEGNLGFWGYLWQGVNAEALTCNALEWQYSNGGGNFLGPEGTPQLTNPESIEAFKQAASWVGTISPERVLRMDEEDTRLMWERGDAAFHRNWPYVFALSRQHDIVGDKLGVAPIPRGTHGRAATLGGWQLMVSKFSRFPTSAAKLVRFMTSEAEQKLRAINGSYNPTIRRLYRDPEVIGAVPFFEGFEEVYENLVVRPSNQVGDRYAQVSSIYSRAVQDVLAGADPSERLAEAEQRMTDLLE